MAALFREQSRGRPEFQKHLAGAKHMLALTAVDPNGIGLSVVAPLPDVTKLTGRDRELWQMIGTHLVEKLRVFPSGD